MTVVFTLTALTVLIAGVASAAAESGPVLQAPRAVGIGKALGVEVATHTTGDSTVILEEWRAGGWREVSSSVARGASTSLRWRVRSPRAYLTLRAAVSSAAGRKFSRPRHVRVRRPTKVLHVKQISAAPETGSAGKVRYDEKVPVKPGSIVAAGTGPETPYGFLGRVTSVSHRGGGTQLSTRPTTIQAAVPSGDIELHKVDLGTLNASSPPGSASSSALRGRIWRQVSHVVNCKGGGKVAVDGSVSLSPTVSLKASWGLFSGISSRFEAGLSMNADLTASAQAAANCKVGPITLAKWLLQPIDVQVGPIPVVFLPEVKIILSANGSVAAQVSTGWHGQVTATGGVAYEHGDVHRLGGVTHSISFDPPAPTGQAHLAAEVGPTMSLLLYGVAGPEVDLRGGLSFDANTSANPWWTLSAPLSLGAKLSIPVLGVSTGELSIYRKSFVLAHAPGGFGPPPAPTPPPPPAAIVYDGTPGAGSPPATLGPYTMHPFAPDPQPLELVDGVDGPTGRLGFSPELQHLLAPEEPAWKTWSNGYEGDVYADEETGEATVSLPANTKAFYVYVEPDEFSTFEVTVRTPSGATSGAVPVEGEAGARYFGFYSTGGAPVQSVTIACPEDTFAIGEFGISSG